MPALDFYFSERFLRHDAGRGHPEGAYRLEGILAAVGRAGPGIQRLEPREGTRDALLAVHSEAHVARLEGLHQQGGGRLDPDTAMSGESWPAALAAAGAVLQAVEQALADGARAFCAVRPPGHHATRDRAMGFCLLNNIAIGAARALALGCPRVAIVDFDVHHGNGTQDIFYEEPRVLYVSTHQFPYYPGSGAASETGRGAGTGTTVNIPLPAGSGDAVYRDVLHMRLLPELDRFRPALLMLSAGFDAHAADPLGGLRLSTAMFGELTRELTGVAARHADGRVVSVLEGGYDRQALAESVVEHLRELQPPAGTDAVDRPSP